MKILLAVDGSKYGRWAVEWVARIPFKTTPQVTALHVLDIASVKAPFMIQPVVAGNALILRKEIDRLVRFAGKVVTDTTALLAALHLKGKVVKVRGVAAPAILQSSPGPKGLIVMGSRGLTAVDRFMLGSVSMRVTSHAVSSTLVVKQPPRPLRRLVLATDGSKPAQKALRFIVREFRPKRDGHDLEIVVAHVIRQFREVGQAIVVDAADKLRKAGFRTIEVIQLGDPADQILKIAESEKADLIVTGAKGLGALGRFFLGSVSTKLIQHSTCSVLIVR